MLDAHGRVDPNGKFDWQDAVIDAVIMAGLTFFTTLGGMGATGLLSNPKTSVLAAGIAAATEFFAILAVKRGLTKAPEEAAKPS
jgi:hypothetical protein